MDAVTGGAAGRTAALAVVEAAGREGLAAAGPEEAIRAVVASFFDVLGDRDAAARPGALKPGERQYFVGGAFLVTPDERFHMLVGSRGFPPEQERLMVPIDGGHPATVRRTRAPLVLENTDEHGSFRQYLRTSRMGSSIYAPMIWQGDFLGQLIFAAQARNTLSRADLDVLVAVAHVACALWVAHGGPAWLAATYPPPNGYYADREGERAGAG